MVLKECSKCGEKEHVSLADRDDWHICGAEVKVAEPDHPNDAVATPDPESKPKVEEEKPKRKLLRRRRKKKE